MKSPQLHVIVLFALGCNEPEVEDPAPSLTDVSEEITFKSVTSLGPHHMMATITRAEQWEEGEADEHSETIELTWNNWDAFHFRRLVDGETRYESIVYDGQSYSRTQGAAWTTELDPESARLGLRTTWNVWESAFDSFGERIAYEEIGQSVVDTRSARQFRVVLAPIPEGKRIRRSRPQPEAIQGSVWLDEQTGVRLSASVTGTIQVSKARHLIHLQLARSGFGNEQNIVVPAVRVRKSSELLGKKAPPRKTGRPDNVRRRPRQSP